MAGPCRRQDASAAALLSFFFFEPFFFVVGAPLLRKDGVSVFQDERHHLNPQFTIYGHPTQIPRQIASYGHSAGKQAGRIE